jgi:hypothetical protein
LAHERDITFNQLVEEALKNAIEQAKKEIVWFELYFYSLSLRQSFG